MNLKVRLKGGPKSGHYGHAGRPGKVGGSQPGKLYIGDFVLYDNYEQARAEYIDWAKNEAPDHIRRHVLGSAAVGGKLIPSFSIYVLPDDKYIIIGYEHGRMLAMNKKHPDFAKAFNQDPTDKHAEFGAALRAGALQIKVFDKHTVHIISNNVPNTKLLRRIKGLIDGNLLPTGNIDYVLYQASGGYAEAVRGSASELLQAKYITDWKLKELVEYKQLPIDDAARRKLFQVRLEIFYDSSDALAEQVFTGGISIAGWEAEMRALVKDMHTSAAAIGKGGWDAMTSQEWGRLGTPMRQQYKWLHNFAQDIAEQMETISVGTIRSRARMYGRAAGYVAELMQAPKEIIDQLPWIPKDGSTECLSNCKCIWELKVISKIEKVQKVSATWRMTEAEHCDDCPARNGHVVIFEVDAKVQVPAIIGGF